MEDPTVQKNAIEFAKWMQIQISNEIYDVTDIDWDKTYKDWRFAVYNKEMLDEGFLPIFKPPKRTYKKRVNKSKLETYKFNNV
jgi:hypothetical protein